ncbi:MAG: iron complex outermembrane receptor protein, partial [Saprospiraceae bacterium]
VNKTFSVANWAVDVNWVTAYQSEVFFESSNYPGLSQDAYWITDASIKLSPASNRWSVELFADNLFDEEFLIDAGNTGGGLGIPTFVRGNPVIGGLRLYAEM